MQAQPLVGVVLSRGIPGEEEPGERGQHNMYQEKNTHTHMHKTSIYLSTSVGLFLVVL